MNSLEAQLDYCLGTAVPEPGRAVDVSPGIRWVRMSLPFALNHINLWLLRDRIEGEGVASRTHYYRHLVPAVPSAYRRLLDGGTFTTGPLDARAEWRCHVGYGHAPEHMAFHCESARVLISGDMVLPRISTNVSVVDVEPEADPLTLYLDSIERMREIDAGVLVLPSHGLPFKGLHTRIDQLQAHHAERFEEAIEACAKAPQ